MALTEDQYLSDRVDDQIHWYDQKSQSAQKTFKRLRGVEILVASSIPFLAGFSGIYDGVRFLTGLAGVVIVVLTGIISLNQYQENWFAYRTVCESLKHEKYLFAARAEPYDRESPFQLLVGRVEGLISKENSDWSLQTRTSVDASKPNPVGDS